MQSDHHAPVEVERQGVDPALLATIHAAIRSHPEGLSEHALIAELRRQNIEPFVSAHLREPLDLFRTHFLLFHCLYRLRDDCIGEDQWLRIDCLDIGLEPLDARTRESGECSIDTPALNDPLRAYYLDLARLDTTDAAAVEALLGAFWRRMHRDERREQALAVLGLEEPVDEHAVQAKYRSLVQRHHPDRGGDVERVQRFNEARWILMADTPSGGSSLV